MSKPDDPTEAEHTQLMSDTGNCDDADLLAAGTELGDYTIEAVLGAGGCGLVYAARDRVLDRRVAIKVLRSELAIFPSMLARFTREVETLSKLAHPNIVRLYEFRELRPGRPYYVMELLQGQDLRRSLEQEGRLSPEKALELFTPICDAVQAAHTTGIIHRDIKTSNVFVAKQAGERVIKLLDFGIAKLIGGDNAGPGLTEPGARLGSVHNMAPEQVRGEAVDERTDIYALGVLLFQVLTGQYPFHISDPHQLALLHLQAPAPRPSAFAPVPPAVDAVVLRCLEKQPDKRFRKVNELLSAFRAAMAQRPSTEMDVVKQAVGVYFEMLRGAGAEESEDEVFEDVANMVEILEQELLGNGFLLPMRTSTALLGICFISDEAAPSREYDDATALVERLRSVLAERPAPHPLVSVAASVMVGDVLCRAGENGLTVVGGPLLKVRDWAWRFAPTLSS